MPALERGSDSSSRPTGHTRLGRRYSTRMSTTLQRADGILPSLRTKYRLGSCPDRHKQSTPTNQVRRNEGNHAIQYLSVSNTCYYSDTTKATACRPCRRDHDKCHNRVGCSVGWQRLLLSVTMTTMMISTTNEVGHWRRQGDCQSLMTTPGWTRMGLWTHNSFGLSPWWGNTRSSVVGFVVPSLLMRILDDFGDDDE